MKKIEDLIDEAKREFDKFVPTGESRMIVYIPEDTDEMKAIMQHAIIEAFELGADYGWEERKKYDARKME